MKVIIDIPDTDIPKRQDILSVDLSFVDGQVGQCTYPFMVLQDKTIDLNDIYALGLLDWACAKRNEVESEVRK